MNDAHRVPPPASEITTPLKVGDTDPTGTTVEYMFWSTKKYQIYSDDLRIKYVLPEDYDEANAMRRNLYVIAGARDLIESLLQNKTFRTNTRQKYYADRMLARGMAQAFEGEPEGALVVLQTVAQRLTTMIEGYYRRRYISWNAVSLVLVLSALFILLLLLPSLAIERWFPFDLAVVDRYSRLMMFGALGAFLSMSIGARRLSIDVELSVSEHAYAGIARILIGVIGALVIGLALDSRFLSPGFGNEPGLPVLYFLAFIAGFSETLVPNTLARAEQSASQPAEQPPPAAGGTP